MAWLPKAKQLLFSVTRKDLRIEEFRVGGAGGQHRDKTSAGIRITHVESGAVGQAGDSRSKMENRGKAFMRMVDHPKFTAWHKMKTSETLGIEKQIRVRCHDGASEWGLCHLWWLDDVYRPRP